MTTVNTLQSGGQGTAVPAGYIAEKVETTPNAAGAGTTSTADTWTDASAIGTLTLSAGTWIIGYDLALGLVPTTGTQQINANVRLYNVTDATAVANSVCFTGTGGTSQPITNWVSKTLTINISGTKTFRVETRCNAGSASATVSIVGTAATGGLTDPDCHSILRATKIA